MTTDLIVPTVDVSGWMHGDESARDAIAQAVDHAGRTIGFMQVVGHGIPADAVDGLTGAMDDFFAQPVADKMTLVPPRPSINRGYAGTKSEKLSYSLGLDSPADLFEAFNVGATHEDFPHLDLRDRHDDNYASNLWPDPDAVPTFRPGVEAWFAEAASFARRMTSIFARALAMDDDYFDSYTDHSIDVLRMVNYAVEPGTEIETGQLGMGAHTDYGIVTVLWADPVPGLQVLGPDGEWHDVTPAPGALLINLGDLLARWSNDRWVSTMHRVVPPVDADGRSMRRRSAAFFHDGNADALISTIESCRDASGGSAYDDVKVAEHLFQKLNGSRGLELNQHAAAEASRIEGVSS
ncbi:MAG: 2-oxoglutarate and iron-dependent oxygenase domain-containing protein [Actinomycetota bacterium]